MLIDEILLKLTREEIERIYDLTEDSRYFGWEGTDKEMLRKLKEILKERKKGKS